MQKGRKGPGGDGEKNAAVFDNKNRDAPEAPSEQREAQNSLVLPRAAVTLEARTHSSAEAGAAHPAACRGLLAPLPAPLGHRWRYGSAVPCRVG